MRIPPKLSHLDARGRAQMVDISAKGETPREAVARGFVSLRPDTLRLIHSGAVPKGDVYAVARLAGILAAKRVHELVPLCHPLLTTAAHVECHSSQRPSGVRIESRVKTTGRTGTAAFSSTRTKNRGTFTFTVTGITISGSTYSPTNNVETSDSIATP